jgi:predicted O-linked N-acetylglucosamine transferase (SPINDLY family)
MTDLPTRQTLDAAMEFHRGGDALQAEAMYLQVLSREPNHAEALHLLGLLTSQMGRQPAALELIERAIHADPLAAEYRVNLGVVLEEMGRPEEAIAAYRLAIDLRPDLADAHVNLGNILAKQKRWDEAIAAYRAALANRPGNPRVHNNLGAALYNSGQIDPAIAELRKALELQPDFPDALNNLGNAMFLKGELDWAITAYEQAAALNPDLIDAQINLANALDRGGRRDEALAAHLRIARARPDHGPTHLAIGDSYYLQGKWDEAADAYRRAIALQPKDDRGYLSLGNALSEKKDLDGAVAAFRTATALRPDAVEALNNLGVAMKEQGRLDDALECCLKALAIDPNNAQVHSNLVYLLSFHPGYDPPALAKEQRRWNELHARPLKSLIQGHANDRSPDRRLKIGYVSPDFRQHVVGQNMLPLLGCHDHERFEIFCYASSARSDSFTELLRPHADMWRNVASRTDEELAKIVREDQIDILVDLSLHMAHNRLGVFARKPAPVQVTYLGYCAGTGLDAIDHRLSDPYLDPSDSDLSLYSEKTIRLPETYWCYGCAGPTPQPSPPPSAAAGYITFGCLNNFAKVSWVAQDLWAQVLAAVPNSRMIIHSYPGSHLDEVRERFFRKGVAPDRLEFVTKQPWPQYVATYGRIDIALDPLPWGGGITTCDALWMGVPVVSLVGRTAVGRGGKSILSNIGLGELAARRTRQYVQTAIALAESPSRLVELRGSLRQRMLTSPLMNARKFARNVENAYREMWRQWCVASDKRV